MTIAVINTFLRYPAYNQNVTLAGQKVEIRLRFRERQSSWYMDLYDVEGNALVTGRRLEPGWNPLAGVVDDGLDGLFYVRGPDEPYGQKSLGTTVFLEFVSSDSVPPRNFEIQTERIVLNP